MKEDEKAEENKVRMLHAVGGLPPDTYRIWRPTLSEADANTIAEDVLGERGGQVPGKEYYGTCWDVVLTEEEIEALAAGVSPMLIRPEHIVSYYPMVAKGEEKE